MPVTRDQALLETVIAQRNEAQDHLASTLADLRVANESLNEAQAKLAELAQLRDRLDALEERLPIETVPAE